MLVECLQQALCLSSPRELVQLQMREFLDGHLFDPVSELLDALLLVEIGLLLIVEVVNVAKQFRELSVGAT